MILKFLAVLLVLIAGYLCWWAMEHSAAIWFLAASILLLCGVGLSLRRYWASYLWYSLAIGTSLWWVFTISRLALHGWPVHGAEDTIISLLPGMLLLVVCIGGSLAVRKEYKQIGPR